MMEGVDTGAETSAGSASLLATLKELRFELAKLATADGGHFLTD
jgi:hypothetical protein